MKTVQEYLKQTDINQLIDGYINKYPIKLSKIPDHMSVRDAKARERQMLMEYIEHLRGLTPKPSEDNQEYILFWHGVFDIERPGISSLVCMEELLQDGAEAECYAYSFSSQEEIVGYFVSEDKFTQKNLVALLVDVLYEASFFGFYQEARESELVELERSLQELEQNHVSYHTWAEFCKEMGYPRETAEKDDKEQELYRNATRAVYEYECYLRRKELLTVRNTLIQSGVETKECEEDAYGKGY